LTKEALRNGEYRSRWPRNGVVRLSDGVYREKGASSELVVTLSDMYAFGDLNADGAEDAAVVLVAKGAGSGGTHTLEAVINENGRPKHVATTFLGDTIDLKAVAIDSGQIRVRIITHGPNPACCPPPEVTKRYRLEGDELVRMPDPTGPMPLETRSSD